MRTALFMLCGFTFFTHLSHAATPDPVNAVFQFAVKVHDPDRLSLNWIIKHGYFLYANRIEIISTQPDLLKVGVINFPQPFEKKNRQGYTDKLYQNHLALDIPVLVLQPGEYHLQVHYQGCADDGFCYPPQDQLIQLSFNKEKALFQTSLLNPMIADPKQSSDTFARRSETISKLESFVTTQTIEQAFYLKHPLVIVLMFMGFGLLLSFTPCVLPMIPVLSSLIIRHGHDLSTRKAFFLSLSYVLGMAITYALIGAIAATLGANLQVLMQQPVMIGIMALIFALLALSMFGLYELTLPTRWQAQFAQLTRNQANGHYWNAALMGCLSTLVLSPCVTPPLVGALSYILQSGNILLGSSALFALGLGMGIPLLLIGISSGKWLPRAGHWMNTVKAFFGILLLFVSLYLLSRLLSAYLMMVLWSVLLVFSGIFAGALESVQHPVERLFKGIGILSLTYGLLILTGFALDNTDPLHPLKGITRTALDADKAPYLRIKTLSELNQALDDVRGYPVMLDFYADWCASCKVMEAETLKDPLVNKVLERFKVLIVDLSANTPDSKAIMDRFHVVAPPTFVFLNAEGEEITSARIVGEVSSKTFHGQISNIQIK